jgi:hypothetical protein
MNMADTVNVTGYGIPGLDFYVCAFGKFLAIETKAPGKKPTSRQTLTINELCRAGAKVFVIDSMDTSALKAWLKVTQESNHEQPSVISQTASDRRAKRRSAEGAVSGRARTRNRRRQLSHDAARRSNHALAPLPRARGARAYSQQLRLAR